MTLDDFERLVLKLANQEFVRYWKHWNYPCGEPWLMAVSIQCHKPEPRLMDDLERLGLTLKKANENFNLFYTVRRTFTEDK